jgi:hypothetical protein
VATTLRVKISLNWNCHLELSKRLQETRFDFAETIYQLVTIIISRGGMEAVREYIDCSLEQRTCLVLVD